MDEFGSFVHPQRAEHMIEHVVMDQLKAYDKDGNGEISRKEYLSKSMPVATCVIRTCPFGHDSLTEKYGGEWGRRLSTRSTLSLFHGAWWFFPPSS